MATTNEKLAAALADLRALQARGVVAVRSTDLSRTHRERLLRAGFLRAVMKGWFVPASPGDAAGDSTAWYASYWAFCAAYLESRFGAAWRFSPEQSLALHVGNRTVPRQLLVRAPKGGNAVTPLPFRTSLLEVRTALDAASAVEADGLRLYSLPAALIAAAPGFFQSAPTDARAALAAIRDASELLDPLLADGRTTVAGRLAGALRNIGRDRIADDLLAAMRAAGHDVRESDPFERPLGFALPRREVSPAVVRLRLLWDRLRGTAIERFPAPPRRRPRTDDYLRQVREAYVADAYHSLSIEGYRVDAALIERVRSGGWNPDADADDRGRRDALAARGYWLAHREMQKSLRRVLRGENPGAVAAEDHGGWYRALFAPGVGAGLLRARDLAGYRNGPVYIRGSMHVPPQHAVVRDAMPAFFDLLAEETEPAARVVLGHFLFVYIHPYADGNGRIGRLLMNLMLASAGWPWTIVPVERRADYMAALEAASVRQDVGPFAELLAELIAGSGSRQSVS